MESANESQINKFIIESKFSVLISSLRPEVIKTYNYIQIVAATPPSSQASKYQSAEDAENEVQTSSTSRLMKVYIIMDKADFSLQSYMSRDKKQLTQEAIWAGFRDMCNVLCYFQNIGVCHRDIKPSNILIKNGRFKLSDFGTVKQ